MILTIQEYYDRLVCATLDGTMPSPGPDCKCLYRNAEGKACGVGVGIADEEYQPEMDDTDDSNYDDNILVQNVFPPPHGMTISDMVEIQICHDKCANIWSESRFLSELHDLPCFSNINRISGVPCN